MHNVRSLTFLIYSTRTDILRILRMLVGSISIWFIADAFSNESGYNLKYYSHLPKTITFHQYLILVITEPAFDEQSRKNVMVDHANIVFNE